MIPFESGGCSQPRAGFTIKFSTRARRRHPRCETWNNTRTNRCRAIGPRWGRSKQGRQDMWHRLHSGKVDFSIRIVLRGCLDSGVAIPNWQNGDAEARKIRADEIV